MFMSYGAGAMPRQFDILDRIGRELKFDAQDVIAIRNGIEAAASVASLVAGGVAIFNTATTLLTAFGIMEDSAARTEKLLASIDAKLEIALDRLEADARAEILGRRTTWKLAVQDAHTALDDLRSSRSATHFDEAVRALGALSRSLGQMMDYGREVLNGRTRVPYAGIVPYVPENYQAPEVREKYTITGLPDHWFFYDMVTQGGIPAPRQRLEEVWDAGYYVDLVAKGAESYLRLLTLIEPYYRSTGERRNELKEIADKLKVFVDWWEYSLLVTPIDQQVGDGIVGHPFRPFFSYLRGKVALGVVDLVTGTSMLDTSFDAHAHMPDWGSPAGPSAPPFRDAILNEDEVRGYLEASLRDMVDEMKDYCGITNMRVLQKKLQEVTYGPGRSLIARVNNVRTHSDYLWEWPDTEFLTLPPAIALGAGKPKDKKYSAKRRTQGAIRRPAAGGGSPFEQALLPPAIKTFRFPLARRMDASLIQLGYRMEVSIAGGSQNSGKLSIDLCDYDTWQTPQVEPSRDTVFPFLDIERPLEVHDATVYDAVQSAPFTAEEERASDAGEPVLSKRREFINERLGTAAIRVRITTRIDLDTPDHAFLGYANVAIELLHPDIAKDSFIVGISVYETGQHSDISEPSEQVADTVALHIIPTFLIPEDDFFADWDAGEVGFRKMMTDVPELVIVHDWGPPPIYNRFSPAFVAHQRKTLTQTVSWLERQHPELATDLCSRHVPPPVVRERPVG
jgi:hypothetical protein